VRGSILGRKTYKKIKNIWLEYAANLCGSQSELARRLKITPQSISFWLYNDVNIPLRICKNIEKVTNGKVKCANLNKNISDSEMKIAKNHPKARKE
jgi:DNA-binding transcriptional regulator YdaS (Cro superfamily)